MSRPLSPTHKYSYHMALVQFGSLVTGIRGKSGGSLFSTNNGTAYVSNQSRKTKSFASQNKQQKSRYNQVQSLWKSLTAEQRETWQIGAASETYIDKIGNKRHYAPRSLFFERNLNLLQVSATPINEYSGSHFILYPIQSSDPDIRYVSSSIGLFTVLRGISQMSFDGSFSFYLNNLFLNYSIEAVGPTISQDEMFRSNSESFGYISKYINLYPSQDYTCSIYFTNFANGKKTLIDRRLFDKQL